MKQEEFEGYIVPPILDMEEAMKEESTQDGLCDKNNEACLYVEELDCKDCLLSSKNCPASIFEHWKKQKREENE